MREMCGKQLQSAMKVRLGGVTRGIGAITKGPV